jgi:hypothetical protein
MIAVMVEQDHPAQHLSHPPMRDVLTARERARVLRSKREQRRREFAAFPITGRDEALYSLDAFAANELLRQPEVRARLARAALAHERIMQATIERHVPAAWLAHARLGLWIGLEALDADHDGVLRGAGELHRLVRQWPKISAKMEVGWPVFSSAGWVGRPGIEQSMTRENVLVALRSLALRPRAREALQHGAIPDYREPTHRSQRGHKIVQGSRARGASYADELAASEVGEHETRKHVEKQRARLMALLAEARA